MIPQKKIKRLEEYIPCSPANGPAYSTHYMQLGYIDVSSREWANTSIFVSNTFYDVQHWSTHILTLARAVNTVKSNYLKIGGTGRNFYYKDDTTNKRIYIYVEVNGGNGFGTWQTQQFNNIRSKWISEIIYNISKEDSWVSIAAVN